MVFSGLKIKLNLMSVLQKPCHEGYFLEVSNQYPDNLQNFHNDLLVLPKRMKSENAQKR